MENKGSLRISVDDITYGDINRELTEHFQNAYQYRRTAYDTRRVGLNFTYNFGNEKFARKRKHQDNAADDLKGRIE